MTEKTLHHRERVYISKDLSFDLDSTTSVLLEILTSVESEGRPSFAIVGGFTRNQMANKDYNDFDICSRDIHAYRTVLSQMGLLITPEKHEVDGIRQHDQFLNPYDMHGLKYNIHWVETDSEHGYAPPTFDFGINEFSLKSDRRIHAPTFSWREWSRRQIKINPMHDKKKFSTNLALRAIRFAALLDFKIEQETEKLIYEKMKSDKLDQVRLKRSCEKFIEDGVGEQALKMMKQYGFPVLSDNLYEVIAYADENIKQGRAYREPNSDYHAELL